MLTLGQLNEKISVLRSKIAVTKGLVLYLKTHYMPSDGSKAEMHFTRSDHGRAPPEHIELYLVHLVEQLDGFQLELESLENTPLTPKEPEKPKTEEKIEEKIEEKVNGVPQNASKSAPTPRKETHGAARPSQDQPTPAQPAAGRQAQ